MAFFLKKTNNKKGVYLQIYESFYDPIRQYTAHRSYKPIGYVHELIASGIDDPISFFKEEVDQLNFDANEEKSKSKRLEISDSSPERYLGYFPLKNINDSLKMDVYFDLLQTQYDLHFRAYDLISSLIYSRVVFPCSKLRTFEEVMPQLYDAPDFSLSQLYAGLDFMGNEYEKIIEIYNHHISKKYKFNTEHTYFDCTNFYFEIDKEDDFRKKGPSKENRKDPLVGLGLLLDANQIPIGMKIFPGNQSEKPVLRDIIDDLKSRNNINGRTIQVADKGLNCAENIFHAKRDGDGYIFSKSVKMLPETEKTWVLLDNDFVDVKDSKGEIVYRIKECIDKFPYSYTDQNGKKKKIELTEKRVVTFNPSLAKKKIIEIHRQVEKAKYLSLYKAKKNEYGDSAKYVTFSSTSDGETTDDKVSVSINHTAIENDLKLAGFNMIVTSETNMKAQDIYDAYHNLWRIEESFKLMKSQLEARPVYLQKENNIIGHFLICYLSVLLLRIFQFHVLDNKYSTEEIMKFIKGYRAVKMTDKKYINISRNSDFIKYLSKALRLPLTSYYLSESQIKMMLTNKV